MAPGLKSNNPTKIERITIEKLDNGYCVSADTKIRGVVAHYCSNLKGVTKALWLFFEGKERLTRAQAEGLKRAIVEAKERKSVIGEGTKEPEERK